LKLAGADLLGVAGSERAGRRLGNCHFDVGDLACRAAAVAVDENQLAGVAEIRVGSRPNGIEINSVAWMDGMATTGRIDGRASRAVLGAGAIYDAPPRRRRVIYGALAPRMAIRFG
jgi:hypothetical protein